VFAAAVVMSLASVIETPLFRLLIIAAAAALGAAAVAMRSCGPSVELQGTLGLLLSSRLLPPAAVVIPLYLMAHGVGLLDTRSALILTYGAVNLPVALWLLQPIFGTRATDQEEAAQLDGAAHLSILFGILLPMIRGALAATAVIVFLLCWNEYLFAALLTSDHALTLPPWMVGQLSMKEAQAGGEAEELAHLSAAAVLMAVPALALATFAHRLLGRSLIGTR
jgi:ABC-type glycerol-3-phosphate transport system permease component